MKKAREMVNKMMNNKNDYDEDEKKVRKHLSHDIKESKKSIQEDRKLKKALKKDD